MRPTGPNPRTVALVLERDDAQCVVCASIHALQVHHRRPRGMGGTRRLDTNSAANLIVLCRQHHEYVETHRAWALTHGLLVPQHGDPARVPVRTWRGWVKLAGDGTEERTEERP